MSGLSKKNLEYVKSYWNNKLHQVGQTEDYFFFAYASQTGKYGRSHILDEFLIENFTPIEVYLWTAVMARVKGSRNFFDSGVIKFDYPSFKNLCSNKIFYAARKKFVKHQIIIKTLQNQYYILNPLYTNKFYKSKCKKENDQ